MSKKPVVLTISLSVFDLYICVACKIKALFDDICVKKNICSCINITFLANIQVLNILTISFRTLIYHRFAISKD